MIRLLLLSIILLFVTSCAYNPYETRGQRTVKGVLLGAGAGGVVCLMLCAVQAHLSH